MHFSISQYTLDDYDITFRKDGGSVVHPPTGESFEFLKTANVYFIKMRVPRSLVKAPPIPEPVFGRQGAAP